MGCHFLLQCMKVKSEREVAQSCLTLRDPMVCLPPGSSIHGIFQARVLEWGAIAFSAKKIRLKETESSQKSSIGRVKRKTRPLSLGPVKWPHFDHKQKGLSVAQMHSGVGTYGWSPYL